MIWSLAVHGGHRRIALDHTLGGRHLGAVVVGHVALTDRTLLGAALGVSGEELADSLRFGSQPFDPGAFLGSVIG